MNELERNALARIRKECEDRAEAPEIGGARWQFDMFWLVRLVERQDRLLKQAHFLADQGIDNSGAVNAYRLKAVLDGERTVGGA